jgi:two-component system OmpR family sensor kinase
VRANALLPVSAALLPLVGSLAATLTLHRAASAALEREMDERLRGAGASAAVFFARVAPTDEDLSALMAQNGLDGAFVVNRELRMVADASGERGRKVDLLRVDTARIAEAFAGRPSVGLGYQLDELRVGSAYFPIRQGTEVTSVLALEAGTAFVAAGATVRRARNVSIALSLLSALALGLVGARWARAERLRRQDAERAARGEALTRMAATAAHEIRNPLGIIRATVELMSERSSAALSPKDRLALSDILEEVERLKRLTEDLLDLSADRPLASARVSLPQLLEELRRAFEGSHPENPIRYGGPAEADVEGDPGRLRQVFLNLLVNAAQAQGPGEIELTLTLEGASAAVKVRDHGPGVSPQVQARLFEPFATGKSQGTGLGLAVSRRLIERHRGTLQLLPSEGKGAIFEVRLPLG